MRRPALRDGVGVDRLGAVRGPTPAAGVRLRARRRSAGPDGARSRRGRARGDPPPRGSRRAADRLPVRQPGGSGCLGRRLRAWKQRGAGRARRGPLRRHRVGRARNRRELRGTLLRRRRGPLGVLGRHADPRHVTRGATIRAEDDGAREPLRRPERPSPRAHLDVRHRAGPRHPPPAGRRCNSHLSRVLLRDIPRSDLCQRLS